MDEKVRGKSSDGIVSRYINRKISMRITALILKYDLNITPTQITVICTLIGYIVFPLYIYGYNILAGIIAQLASIVDGVDGELARARNLVSGKGAFIDSILDRTVDIGILLGAIYYSYNYQGFTSITNLIIYLLGLSGWIMVSYLHARIQLNLSVDASSIGVVPRIASRDVRIFIIFLGSIFSYIYHSILITAFLSYFYVVLKFIESVRRL